MKVILLYLLYSLIVLLGGVLVDAVYLCQRQQKVYVVLKLIKFKRRRKERK